MGGGVTCKHHGKPGLRCTYPSGLSLSLPLPLARTNPCGLAACFILSGGKEVVKATRKLSNTSYPKIAPTAAQHCTGPINTFRTNNPFVCFFLLLHLFLRYIGPRSKRFNIICQRNLPCTSYTSTAILRAIVVVGRRGGVDGTVQYGCSGDLPCLALSVL
jgi:hypothetical protein